ncbi:MAG: carboxypeptidase-like regulatory domain-containing protein [Saprospiraceae bacterium]|nr:carboxypeptidase-like regulatory domain-containing protein [Saprospiraceae bacterium]
MLLLAISLFSLPGIQGQNTIRGSVQDSRSQALSAATALLRQAKDSALVKGVICTEQGAFLFENPPPGNFLVEINMLGYSRVFSKPFTVRDNESAVDLGAIMLNEDNNVLNEVSVVAAGQ